MDSDISDRYNDGIVPPPDLVEDVPPLRQAGSGVAPKSARRDQRLTIAIIVAVLVVAGLCCLVAVALVILQAKGGV